MGRTWLALRIPSDEEERTCRCVMMRHKNVPAPPTTTNNYWTIPLFVYSSIFGVSIAITFTRFFYVRKATSNHDPFKLYASCILRGQFRLNIHGETLDMARECAVTNLSRHWPLSVLRT